MFLTEADLFRMTGYSRPSSQRKWLKRNGWKFEPDANGRPIVLRSYAEAQLGAADAATQTDFTPDFSAIR